MKIINFNIFSKISKPLAIATIFFDLIGGFLGISFLIFSYFTFILIGFFYIFKFKHSLDKNKRLLLFLYLCVLTSVFFYFFQRETTTFELLFDSLKEYSRYYLILR
jgi:hypothetical protein